MRMVKPKGTRTTMNVPQWVRDEWATGNKDAIADLFVRENFNKDRTISHIFLRTDDIS